VDKPNAPSPSPALSHAASTSWFLLAVLWCVLLLLAAWRPLALPDEGRYSEIGRWMLVSGDWLTPRLNGIPFFHKPPLLYWLEAISMGIFGVHAWAARLVPALHAGLMLTTLYIASRFIGGELLARRATLMLGTSLSFLIGGQYINHDMLVACWIGVAIWSFAAAFMEGERPGVRLALIGFIACALGVLTKGLIGIALPGLVLLLWLIWTRQLHKIIHLPWLRGLALFCVLALPWFVLVYQQFPTMLSYMFGTQQFSRFTGTTFNNARAWWFYLLCLVLLLFPWTLFLRTTPYKVLDTRQKAWLSLLWIWVAAIVVFFSLPHSKLIGYVLPVMPALALLAAIGYGEWMKYRPHMSRWLLPTLALLAMLLAMGTTMVAGRFSLAQATIDVAQTLACEASPDDTIYALDGYPYDLPFYTGAKKPMVVIQDWAELRRSAGDSWQRELFEGADFDASAAGALQGLEVLAAARNRPGNWLLLPSGMAQQQRPAGWTPVQAGVSWTLLRSTSESPVTAQHKGLSGCKH
jgi:4-amino-4-deoxy-L-arabinose transferase-like glycosyltransferase